MAANKIMNPQFKIKMFRFSVYFTKNWEKTFQMFRLLDVGIMAANKVTNPQLKQRGPKVALRGGVCLYFFSMSLPLVVR